MKEQLLMVRDTAGHSMERAPPEVAVQEEKEESVREKEEMFAM